MPQQNYKEDYMYKLQQNGVKRLSDGAGIPLADGNMDYEEYKQWLSEGNTPEPEFTAEELLANAKASKKQELESAFNTVLKQPVTVGTKSYNGGKESSQAIRDYIQAVAESGGTVYTIWDSSNVIANYTLEEANAIKMAIASVVLENEFKLRTKKNDVDNATTIEAVNAIVW